MFDTTTPAPPVVELVTLETPTIKNILRSKIGMICCRDTVKGGIYNFWTQRWSIAVATVSKDHAWTPR